MIENDDDIIILLEVKSDSKTTERGVHTLCLHRNIIISKRTFKV
jgi:hypothetical protein